jgi:UV DNA damage repair endonuclease
VLDLANPALEVLDLSERCDVAMVFDAHHVLED